MRWWSTEPGMWKGVDKSWLFYVPGEEGSCWIRAVAGVLYFSRVWARAELEDGPCGAASDHLVIVRFQPRAQPGPSCCFQLLTSSVGKWAGVWETQGPPGEHLVPVEKLAATVFGSPGF